MCECGCTQNCDRYCLPGPGKSVYLITLYSACTNCDVPDGITIELFLSLNAVKDYSGCDEVPEQIALRKWSDSMGAAILTGRPKHEFVNILKSHLVGLNLADFVDKGQSSLDTIAAETILEEMYDDSTMRPQLVKAQKGIRKCSR